MNIAEHIMADAESFARTCLGLGYDTSNVEGGVAEAFRVTPEQAAEIVKRANSEDHNERGQHGS